MQTVTDRLAINDRCAVICQQLLEPLEHGYSFLKYSNLKGTSNGAFS